MASYRLMNVFTAWCALWCMLIVAPSAEHLHEVIITKTGRDTVCSGSIAIFMSVASSDHWELMKTCTIVKGNIRITLLDGTDYTTVYNYSYEYLSLPLLREVTGYVLLNRNLLFRTFAYLFPNLAIIGGSSLFNGYALVLMNNYQLEEIGLPKLNVILNGGVRIHGHPKLCYAGSIKWNYIMRNSERFVFSTNKDQKLCFNKCPMYNNGSSMCPIKTQPDKFKAYFLHRPGLMNSNFFNDDDSEHGLSQPLCWNNDTCQIVCPAECGIAGCYKENGNMNCCHKNCVGGCLNETAASCVGCLRTHLGACVDKCPPGTYDTNDRWCLNETTCAEENGFILGDKCLEDCPAGYANESNFCVYCGDYCFSSCSGREISREEHLEYFKGCTVINGSLKIVIRGGSSVMEALERGLSSVRIITGYLKIFHVTALVNLKFLNKLEVILGTNLLYDRYAIAILGNRDLEQLWQPEGEPLKYSKLVRNEFEKDFKELISLDGSNQMNNKIKIGRGQVMLHYNGKLCLHVIENFVQLLGYNFSTISDIDVSRVSNGDLNSCDKISINVTVKSVEEHLVKLLWNHEKFRDTRQHLGYKIYYKKIKENETITSYSMTDACAHDRWNVVLIKDRQKTKGQLENLYAFTRYAFYVEAYMVASSKLGAISAIGTFKTNQDKPSNPENVVTFAVDSSKLLVRWSPPINPQGILTHYYLRWGPADVEDFKEDVINYCHENTILHENLLRMSTSSSPTPPSPPLSSANEHCCSCEEDKKFETDMEDDIQFDVLRFNELSYDTLSIVPEKVIEFRKKIFNDDGSIALNGSSRSDKDTNGGNRSHVLSPRLPSGPALDLNDIRALYAKHIRDGDRNATNGSSRSSSNEDYDNDDDQSLTNLSDADFDNLYRRNLSDKLSYKTRLASKLANLTPDNVTYNSRQLMWNETEYVISDLRHFKEYMIEVVACNTDPNSGEELCGEPANVIERTLAIADANSIENGSVSHVLIDMTGFRQTFNSSYNDFGRLANVTGGDFMVDVMSGDAVGDGYDVAIRWLPPTQPNGVILFYELEVLKVETVDLKPDVYCISSSMYKSNLGYTLRRAADGRWSFRVRAVSTAGPGPWTYRSFFTVPLNERSSSLLNVVIVAAVIFSIFLLVASAIVIYCKMRRRLPKDQVTYSINPEYVRPADVYEPDEWEIERSKVTCLKELGSGSFGKVFEGIVKNLPNWPPTMKVALKTTLPSAAGVDIVQFLKEASRMKVFKNACNHVVKLYGVVSQGKPPYVVMELMSRGDLRDYLRIRRNDSLADDQKPAPSRKEMWRMAAEIADGMAFLHHKGFIHRDLACRNCLVSEDHVVKIADFGMTRDIYLTDYYRRGDHGVLPIRWMPKESIEAGFFSYESDVWSYGVVLWEIATLGHHPYMGLSNIQVCDFVMKGGRPNLPEGCDSLLATLMKKCWIRDPASRITFQGVLDMLVDKVADDFKEVSYYVQVLKNTDKSTTKQSDDTDNSATSSAAMNISVHTESTNIVDTSAPNLEGRRQSKISIHEASFFDTLYNSRELPMPIFLIDKKDLYDSHLIPSSQDVTAEHSPASSLSSSIKFLDKPVRNKQSSIQKLKCDLSLAENISLLKKTNIGNGPHMTST